MLHARNHKKRPPPELELAFLCGENHLPDVGGILDQDYDLFTKMRFLHLIYYTVQNAPKYVGKQIHDMPSSMKRIVVMLNELRLWTPAMQTAQEPEKQPVKGIGQ